MLNALIDFSLKNRFVVLLARGRSSIVLGVRPPTRLPLDAFPDTTPVQVQINTVAPELSPGGGRAADHLPRRARPGGLEGARRGPLRLEVRPLAGRAIFEDGTDIYFARQQINERLGEVQLPEGIERPTMGPVATGPGRGLPLLPHERDPDTT